MAINQGFQDPCAREGKPESGYFQDLQAEFQQEREFQMEEELFKKKRLVLILPCRYDQ
jgi:hypothetical protein